MLILPPLLASVSRRRFRAEWARGRLIFCHSGDATAKEHMLNEEVWKRGSLPLSQVVFYVERGDK